MDLLAGEIVLRLQEKGYSGSFTMHDAQNLSNTTPAGQIKFLDAQR